MNITLRFDKMDYSEALPFKEEDLIHRKEMVKAIRIFDGLYSKALAHQNQPHGDGMVESHSNLSIFASRGEGKTSFMLTLQNRIREKYPDCLCLYPIDPSHIESKQHPFVNIIAAIQEKVDDVINTSDVALNINQRYDDYILFQKCYSRVLNGLHIIDGIGSEKPYDGWDDDDYISLQGMTKAKASNNLETNFHEYVRRALILLKKKCIVIAFDDIDTDFKKGFDILEVIRKFLTTPQIITILTGDQTLYTKLVRKSHWKFFDHDYLNKEMKMAGMNVDDFAQMVNQLENQYMVKILKPENRVTIQSLQEFLDQDGNDITIMFGENQKGSLINTYKGILDDLGAKSTSQSKLVRFLTGMPLRIQMRILTLRCRLLKQNLSVEEMREEMTAGLMDTFSTDIYQTSGNARTLINGTPIYTIEMLNLLWKNHCLSTATSFMPETGNDVLDKVLMVVGLKFDQYLNISENRFLIFDFWLRMCYMNFLSERIESKNTGSKGKITPIDGLLEFNRLHTDTGLIKSMGLSLAYFNGSMLPRMYQSSKPVNFAGTIFLGNSIPNALAEKNDALPLIALTGTLDARNNENVFLSIYHLLAIVSEFLRYIKYNPDTNKEKLLALMQKLGQYRNYIEPVKQEPDLGRTDKSKEWDYLTSTAGTHILEDLVLRMQEWQKKKKQLKLSVQQLDRIFTRFYYTLVHIDEQSNYTNIGIKFNDIIIALINSALVESAIEEGIPDVNLNNIGYIEKVFIDNWQIMHRQWKKKEQTFGHFAHWLSSCPLLRLYMNPMLLNLMKNHTDDDSQMLAEVLSYGYDLDNKANLLKKKEQTEEEKNHRQYILAMMNLVRQYQNLPDEIDSLREKLQKIEDEPEKGELAEAVKKELDDKKKQKENIENTFIPFDPDSEYYGSHVFLSIDEEDLNMLYQDALSSLTKAAGADYELERRISELDKKIKNYSNFVVEEYKKVSALPQTKTSLYTLYSQIPIENDED